MNNKNIRFIALLTLLSATAVAAAQERVDTIAVLRGASSVLLISETDKSASEITVEVKASGAAPAYTYKYSSRVATADQPFSRGDSINLNLPFMQSSSTGEHRRFYSIWGSDAHIGPLMPVANDPGFSTGWELGISKIAGVGFRPWHRGPALELGVGMVYRNLRLDRSHIFASDNRGILYIEPLPDGYHRPSSRLDMWSVVIPLTLRQKLCGDFFIDLGVEMLINFSAKATRNYRSIDQPVKYSQTLKHLHQRPVSMDLKFSLGWDNIIGAYLRYSPISLFAAELGPQTDFISAGVSFSF